jgi:peptidyl-prolyl cis-trans isomerase A (cyclophilin A)
MSGKWCAIVGGLAAFCGLVTGCSNAESVSDPPVPRVDTQGAEAPSEAKGPEQYWVKLETTKGDVIIECNRKWSPYGSDRFYELVKAGFFDGCKFFRVVPGFVVQFGINGDPQTGAKWRGNNIPDDRFARGDKNRQSNARGTVTFAKSGRPNSRTTQIFINTKSNPNLDGMGFTPFGKVVSEMAVVDAFYDRYNEEPQQSAQRIQMEGNAYLEKAFPKLDAIKKGTLLPGKPNLPKTPAE